ncbi:MAG: hypothetical protein J6Q01_04700 [Alistipes sp.]|nr:hypothetical protein [Alistipes sp.]
MRTSNRRLNDLVRECVENVEAMPQAEIAILSKQDIVNLVMLTIAAYISDEVYVVESQKEKGRPLHQKYPAPRKLRHS